MPEGMIARLRTRVGTFVRRHTGAPGLAFFPSFEDADRASTGYDDEAIASVVSEKTTILKGELTQASYQLAPIPMQNLVAVSLAARGTQPVSVVEFGGACGATFLEADRFLPGLVGSWTIIETRAMTHKGRSLFETDRLRFYSDFNDTGIERADLLIMSGSLQFTDDPAALLRAMIERFLPGAIYVSRTPLIDGPTMFTRYSAKVSDHGPGQAPVPTEAVRSVPMTFASEQEFYSIVQDGYEIEVRFPDWGPPYPHVRRPIRDHAFLARRKP